MLVYGVYVSDNCNRRVQTLIGPLVLDIFMFRKDEDLHGPALEKPGSLSDTLARWWKMKNHKIAYKLLYMAQHGNKNERYKAVTVLGSLSHLKGKLSRLSQCSSDVDYNFSFLYVK